MRLGAIIYNYRMNNKLSMDDFSKRSGISKAYISLLEKGYHQGSGRLIVPSIETIKKVAAAMNVSFEDLFKSLDQDVTVDDLALYRSKFESNTDFELLYNEFVNLPKETQDRLLTYFKAIMEAERKK